MLAGTKERVLQPVEPLQPLSYETFEIAESLDVQTIASLSGCSSGTITELNPSLRKGIAPKGGFEIRLPDGAKQRFASNYKSHKASK